MIVSWPWSSSSSELQLSCFPFHWAWSELSGSQDFLCQRGEVSFIGLSFCLAIIAGYFTLGGIKRHAEEFQLHGSATIELVFAVADTAVQLVDLLPCPFTVWVGGGLDINRIELQEQNASWAAHIMWMSGFE
jgi:hypothetical protein